VTGISHVGSSVLTGHSPKGKKQELFVVLDFLVCEFATIKLRLDRLLRQYLACLVQYDTTTSAPLKFCLYSK